MAENYEAIKPTNSLVSGSFDVLKMDAVEDPLIDVNHLATMDFEESYFVSSINTLSKLNEDFIYNKIKLYKSLAECSTDEDLVLESFSDYFVQSEDIIEKALKFLKDRLDKFNDTMDLFFEQNTLLKQYKSKLEELKIDEMRFDEYYEFTISEDIPDTSAITQYCNSLFDDLFKSSITDLSIEEIKRCIVEMELEKDYDKFRAQILGREDSILTSNYASELYKVFRNGTAARSEIMIDNSQFKEIVERYFKYSEVKSELNRSFKSIEKAFGDVQKKISSICKDNNNISVSAFTKMLPGDIQVEKIQGEDINTEGIMMSAQMLAQLDIYCKAKLDQLQKYSDLTILAFAAKMDAYKDRFQQDRAVMTTALNNINQN